MALLEDFLTEKIDISSFHRAFFEKYSFNSNAVTFFESNRIILSPQEKSVDFALWLEDIFWRCEQFDELSSDQEINKNKFKNSIKKFFLEIQEYLKE
jgi:hypothetical protein